MSAALIGDLNNLIPVLANHELNFFAIADCEDRGMIRLFYCQFSPFLFKHFLCTGSLGIYNRFLACISSAPAAVVSFLARYFLTRSLTGVTILLCLSVISWGMRKWQEMCELKEARLLMHWLRSNWFAFNRNKGWSYGLFSLIKMIYVL